MGGGVSINVKGIVRSFERPRLGSGSGQRGIGYRVLGFRSQGSGLSGRGPLG